MNLLKQHQAEILQAIYSSPLVKETRKIDGMLRVINDCSSEVACWFTKILGLRIQNFSKLIDLDDPHPDLFSIGDGILGECKEESISHLISDLVTLANFSMSVRVGNQPGDRLYPWHSYISKYLSQAVSSHEDYTKLQKLIGDPQRDLLNIRLCADRVLRDSRRVCKTEQKIGTFWNDEPNWKCAEDNFEKYYFGCNVFEHDLKKAKDRRDHFTNLGLSSMADYVQRDIEKMSVEIANLCYCGFNRISIRLAAIILSKICGLEYLMKNECLRIPAGDKFPKIVHGRSVHFVYRPFLNCVNGPKSVECLIDFLEKYPGLDGHPVFDNYWVLGPVVDCSSAENVTNDMLFRGGHIVGVLLGERQGDHFFICYYICEDQ